MNEPTELLEEGPDDTLFVWACGFELAIGVLGLVVAWVVGIDARAYLPKLEELDWATFGTQAGIGFLAAIPMLIIIELVMRIPHEAINAIKRLADVPTMRALLSLSIPELLVLSLCAGIGEELAFRGCLLPMLTAVNDVTGQMANPYEVGDRFSAALPMLLGIAVVFSSIGFGLVHPITKLYVVIASLMGVYFAGLMIMTDSLVVPIVAHAAYDAVQFVKAKRELAAG